MSNSTVYLALLAAFGVPGAYAAERAITMPIYALSDEGVGDGLGTITLEDSKKGLMLATNLSHLPPGEHGMHVHERANCGSGMKDGKSVAGLGAGSHYDPVGTGKHLGPFGEGHRGDLPLLRVDGNGNSIQTLTAPHLTLADVLNHVIIIHQGGDNYSDDPKPLGGGGPRIACGVVE